MLKEGPWAGTAFSAVFGIVDIYIAHDITEGAVVFDAKGTGVLVTFSNV